MKAAWTIPAFLLLCAAAPTTARAQDAGTLQDTGHAIATDERQALDAAGDATLLDLRAASSSFAASVSESDRSALVADARAHSELATMRAMEDIDNHDTVLILGTIAIVVIIALLL